MVCHVESLYSNKCKEAELAENRVGIFFKYINCTLQEKKQRLKVGLNNIEKKFKVGAILFKNRSNSKQEIKKNPAEFLTEKYSEIDDQTDEIMSTELNVDLTTRLKRDASNEREDEGKNEIS